MKILTLSKILSAAPKILTAFIFVVVIMLMTSTKVQAADQWCAGKSPGDRCLYNGQFYGGPNTTNPDTCEVTNRLWTCSSSLNCNAPGPVDPHGTDSSCKVCPTHGGNYQLSCSNGQWTEKYDDGACGTQVTDLEYCPHGCGTDWNTNRCKPAPPTNTPMPNATNTPVPTATPKPVATATPKPTNPPPPTQTCPDGYCDASGGESCTSCPSDCGVCQNNPTATPIPNATATPVPVCNAPCQRPADCQGAQNGCTACLPNGNGGNTCQVPVSTPTPTPTSIPVCNAPCDQPADCQGAQNGCTVCAPNPNGNGKSCQPVPTATPTPLPFDESMCACDGLDFTPLSLGNESTITAYGKVNGENKNYAKIPSIRFRFMGGGTDPSAQKEIKVETVNTTIVLDTNEMRRYKADWKLTLDKSLSTKDTYRIQAKVNCSRVAAFSPSSQTTAVLAESDKKMGFLDRIAAFFASLLGNNKASNKSNNNTPSSVSPTSTARRNLQLQTIRPATNVEKGVEADNCTFIKFDFKGDK